MSNLSKNDPQNIEQNFDELELVAEKAGELNDRVGKIESELGAQTKTLESAALVLDAAIKGLGALKSSVLENDIGALQLALNDKTAHLAREIGRFESAVAEIDRRAESGDDEIKAALLATAQSLRAQFDAKSAEIGEWSARVEKEIAAHAVALAAIPPIIKGADAVGFNPVGEWETGKAFARMDVVSYAGSSYISNVDGNTEKPSKSKNYTVLSKRAGSIGSGGVGGFAELTGTILPAQLVPGSATYVVGDVLYAGTTGALSKLGAGSSGQLLSTQGAGAAPIWVTATGGAGDMNGPASATDNAIVRFDGTGGKTVQNSAVTIADTTGSTTWSNTGAVLTIAGTTGSTTPTSGALQVIGGAGIGGAIYGGGIISAVNTVYGKASGNGQTATMDPGFYQDTASNVTTQLFGFGNGSRGGVIRGFQNGGNTLVWDFGGITASAFTAHMALTAQVNSVTSGALNILLTTPSTTTTSGALIVAGGVGVSGAGYFGGVLNVTGAATFAGAVTIAGTVIHTLSATPASASAAGTVGTMSWDANYIYICTATNVWKRVAIATW